MKTFQKVIDRCDGGCQKRLFTASINADTGEIILICPDCRIKYKISLRFIGQKELSKLYQNRKEDG